MLNRIIVFVPSSMEKDEYNQRLEATANAEYVYQKLSEMLDSDFCLGIGRSYQGIDNLFRSYEESVKAIRLTGGKGVVHIMDVPIQSKIGQPYPFMKEKLLLEKASVGDAGACLQVFNSIFDWMISEYGDSIQEIKGKLLELMVLLYRLTWDYEVEDQEYLKGQGYIEEILSLQDIASIRKWSKERIEDLVGGINALKDKRISSVILKARDFINVNFSKEITLEDVSREVNISPRYFSRLFKEETGENFIDYLTLIRIKKAKEYLEKGLFSVKEICFQVGYGDPNYFSRIFKKVVGVTPTEYRNS